MNFTNKTSPSDSQTKELQGIQHLRGIAAVLVVFVHIDAMVQFPKYFNDSTHSGFLDVGLVGVHLFFVISGFIIPYVSLSKHSLAPKTTYSSFLRRRFIRIIPFMWACILGFALLRLMGRGVLPGLGYLRAMTLFPVGEVEPYVIWTLRHEFLFYCVFCLTILYSSRQRWEVLAFWFLSPFVWYLLTTNLPDLTFNSFLKELFSFLFSKYNILFGIGFLVGVLHMKGYLSRRWITRHGFIVSLLSTIPLIIAAHFITLDGQNNSFGEFVILGLLAAISLIIGISLDSTGHVSIMDKVGHKLGDASYSIYLTHSAFVSAIIGVWSKIQPSAHFVLIVIGVSILASLGGILVHQFIEKPIITFAQKMLNPKRPAAVKAE